MAKKMLTVKDAAKRLEMTGRGVVYLIETGKLDAVKSDDGRRWLIGAKELNDCIRARAKAAKAKKGKK